MKYDFSIIGTLPGINKENVYFNDLISENLADIMIKKHRIPKNNEIHYICIVSLNDSLVVTPNYISVCNGNEKNVFNFSSIRRVYFSPDEFFYLYDSKDNRVGRIHATFFGFKSKKSMKALNRTKIQNFFTDRIKNNFFPYDVDQFYEKAIIDIKELDVFENIDTLSDDLIEENANKIISIYDNIRNCHPTKYIFFELEGLYASALILKKEFHEALNVVNKVISLCSLNLDYWYDFKAEILKELGEFYEAIYCLEKARNYSSDTLQKFEYSKVINELITSYNDNFTKLSYDIRKIVFIGDEFKSTPKDTFIVLDRHKLPKGINFPNGFAKANELYIAHPYVKESYIPFNEYENQLADDKKREFLYFLQCLGAKRILYRKKIGNEKSESNVKNLNIDGTIEFGKSIVKNKVKGSYDESSETNSQVTGTNSEFLEQLFQPVKKPFIPEDLLWYKYEPSWQRIYQQRINGKTYHHEKIVSSNSIDVSENKKMEIKVAFRNLFVDTNLEIDHLIQNTFNRNDSFEWEFKIEFESLDNLHEVHQSVRLVENSTELGNFTENEYLDEVKFMLEDDGVIDEKERRVLERMRIKLGLSKDRAVQLEKNIADSSSLQKNELEYLEDYKDLLNQGEITEKERRILNRIAYRLNISEDRILELEVMVSEN